MVKLSLQIVSLLLGTFYVVVFLYLIKGWIQIKFFNYVEKATPQTCKVAIIVAARNEALNIALTIECLIAQDYPKQLLEIIIIDDHSTDQTSEIIASYASKGVTLIQLNEDKALNSYKKKAIATAISKTDADLIVTSDADCEMGPNWLRTIVQFYQEGKYKMVSSPVVYHKEKSLFEELQSLEFLTLIGLGAATIGNQKPITCNGANLAYERAAFMNVNGFHGIDDLASGDDELLLHKMTAMYPHSIGFLKNREAIVYTEAKPDLNSFIQQRKRWASKSTKYKNKAMVVLGIAIWAFNLTIILNLILSFFIKDLWCLLALLLFIKLLVESMFVIQLSKFAKRTKLLLLLPILTIVHIFYIVYIGVLGNSGTYQWKDREVR